MKRKIFAVLAVYLLCVSLPQTVFAAQGVQGNSGTITMEAAHKIALDHAQANAAGTTFTEVELDHDRGATVYEIAFIWNNLRYKYEIDAVSGEIRGYSQKEPKQPKQARWNSRSTAAVSGDSIGIDAAKAAALQHAGVSANQANFTKVKFDRNKKRGTTEYKIDFFANEKKYKYKIGASSGEVLEYSIKLVTARW